MQTGPALGKPDYTKAFNLHVAKRAGYACRVLMKATPIAKEPLAYYSTQLENIKAGLPPNHQPYCTGPSKCMPPLFLKLN